MPSRSEKQQRYIFYLRGKYKDKSSTPEKQKWIWDSDWEKVEEEKLNKYEKFFENLNYKEITTKEFLEILEKTQHIHEDFYKITDFKSNIIDHWVVSTDFNFPIEMTFENNILKFSLKNRYMLFNITIHMSKIGKIKFAENQYTLHFIIENDKRSTVYFSI